jgi:hypothetical protein
MTGLQPAPRAPARAGRAGHGRLILLLIAGVLALGAAGGGVALVVGGRPGAPPAPAATARPGHRAPAPSPRAPAAAPAPRGGEVEWDPAVRAWLQGDLRACLRLSTVPQAHPFTLTNRCMCAVSLGERDVAQATAAEFARRYPGLAAGARCASYLRGPEPLGPLSFRRVHAEYLAATPSNGQEADTLAARAAWLARDFRGCVQLTSGGRPSVAALNLRLLCAESTRDLAGLKAACQQLARLYPGHPANKACAEQLAVVDKYGWGR